MTLNGHFALKCVSDWASNGLAFWFSEITVRGFAELRIILSAAKMQPRDCTGGIRVKEVFTGVTEQEASNQ